MRPRSLPALALVPAALLAAHAAAQSVSAQPAPGTRRLLKPCTPVTAVEFVSPMPGEEVPVYRGGGMPQSWHVVVEVGLEHVLPTFKTGVLEGQYIPSPGAAAPLPTDVNGDGLVGDAHPAMPALKLTLSDGLVVNGTFLPPGTNLASLFEMVASEIEHAGSQTTTLTWVVMPHVQVIDVDANQASTLQADVNGVVDAVLFRHGFDPRYAPCSLQSTPTVSIFGPDWISTVDDMVMPGDNETAFLVGVEVRIPCWFDPSTAPPTPVPLDPIPGPGFGAMALTGNFPGMAGPGFHPAFPTLDVRFSDDYFDGPTGTLVAGGVITGGTCATIWGATGQSLAYAFEQSSVQSWYGVDGVPNLAPVLADDQLIYRFTMVADGAIFDTDALPGEMLITATIETECNVFSITNVRVKHRPDVFTPDP